MLYKVPPLEHDWVEIYVNADNLFHKFRRARLWIFYSFWPFHHRRYYYRLLFEEDGSENFELSLQSTNNTHPVLRRVVKYRPAHSWPARPSMRRQGRLLTGIDLQTKPKTFLISTTVCPFPHVDEQIAHVYILNLLEDKLILTFGGVTT